MAGSPSIRVGCCLGVVLACLVAPGAAQPPASRSDGRVAIVAELFTSEGCSSCPPADVLLTEMVTKQPIDGIRVIGLSQHVDYWDRLGWRDRFSSARYTQRQTEYSDRVFEGKGVYTPQMVIDGHLQAVGNDPAEVAAALDRAKTRPKAAISADARRLPKGLAVEVRATVADAVAGSEPLDVVVAIVENGLVTAVTDGENEGETLHHSAVVRKLESIGTMPAGAGGFTKRVSLSVDRGWTPSRLEIVAFLQERKSRRIVGATASTPTDAGQLN